MMFLSAIIEILFGFTAISSVFVLPDVSYKLRDWYSLTVIISSLLWCHSHQHTGYFEYISPTPREIFSCSGPQISAPSLQARSLTFTLRRKEKGTSPTPQGCIYHPGIELFNGSTFSGWAETWIQVSHFSCVCPRGSSLLPKVACPSPPISPREMSNGVVFSNPWDRSLLGLGLGNFPSACFMLGTVMAKFEWLFKAT